MRSPPDESWVWFDSAEALIAALDKLNGQVAYIDLDHDLGDESIYGTGLEVLEWIEKQVFLNLDFKCPGILIHTQNPVGHKNMLAAVRAIERRLGKAVYWQRPK